MQTMLSDDEALERIAANLTRLRGGRSYHAIANLAHTFPASIKRIEDKLNMPGAGLLSRIAEALGVSVDTMYLPVMEAAGTTPKKKLSKAS